MEASSKIVMNFRILTIFSTGLGVREAAPIGKQRKRAEKAKEHYPRNF